MLEKGSNHMMYMLELGHPRLKQYFSLVLVFLLIIAIPLIIIFSQFVQNIRQQASSGTHIVPLYLVSRGLPAFASSTETPATAANDASYDTTWRSHGTGWLAYDISKLPTSRRANMLLVWYNETVSYDHTLSREPAYNLPSSYTIETNPGPGGTQPPTTGWQTVITVTNNPYHSRQHIIAAQQANWIRMTINAVSGVPKNQDVTLNMDLYDASGGIDDDIIDFGDSITATAMGQLTVNGTQSVNELVHQQLTDQFPVVENGGIGHLSSKDGVTYLPTWLAVFPGKFVGLSYGTNDSWGCPASAAPTVLTNDNAMIKMVIAAGKTPILPTMIWSTRPDIQQCAEAINQEIQQLYQQYPQVVKGPDLYTLFQGHPEYFTDGITPNAAGSAIYRLAWAQTIRGLLENQGN
jgi:lysophospholipase L1-like esterase